VALRCFGDWAFEAARQNVTIFPDVNKWPRTAARIAAIAAVALLSAGCQSQQNASLQEAGLMMEDPGFYPSDRYLREGKVYFKNRNYGLAEQSFRKAVEVSPRDTEAWLGLAASYDHLRRFDLADKAYERVLQLSPQNATVLNNAGYSQLLRGDMKSARRFFLKAYELEPDNVFVQNNLRLLGESGTQVERKAL
jgi:Tfp pilus assembly protein PilF